MDWILFALALFIILAVLVIFCLVYTDGDRYWKIINTGNLTDRLKHLDEEYHKKHCLKDTIISFTSTPDRLFNIRPTLISLLDQSVRVREIRVNIPYRSCKGIKYRVPHWLRGLKNVKVARVEKDWGPATKLIPTLLSLEGEPQTKIIVTDDDVIYGYYTVEELYSHFEKWNKNRPTAVTMYGDVIGENHDTENGLYTRVTNYVKGDNFVDILRGHSAYIVTPSMFKGSLLEYSRVPKECFFVDDNYFSAHLKANGVKILQVGMGFKSIPLPEIETCQIGALHAGANHDGKNERVVNRFFAKKR